MIIDLPLILILRDRHHLYEYHDWPYSMLYIIPNTTLMLSPTFQVDCIGIRPVLVYYLIAAN
jgi:hypothetical protein